METCFKLWHTREDLNEARDKQCEHLMEQRNQSCESGKWAHARNEKQRLAGDGSVAPMEEEEEEVEDNTSTVNSNESGDATLVNIGAYVRVTDVYQLSL